MYFPPHTLPLNLHRSRSRSPSPLLTIHHPPSTAGVSVRAEAPPSELAVAVARHFESMEVDEEAVLGGFLSRLTAGQELGSSRIAALAAAASGVSSQPLQALPSAATSGGGTGPDGQPLPAGSGPATSASSHGTTLAAPGGGRSAAADYARQTSHFDGRAPTHSVRKRRRSKIAARPGEQVAAKVTRTDENGSWILAAVQRF